jgi:hypothetical protein
VAGFREGLSGALRLVVVLANYFFKHGIEGWLELS